MWKHFYSLGAVAMLMSTSIAIGQTSGQAPVNSGQPPVNSGQPPANSGQLPTDPNRNAPNAQDPNAPNPPGNQNRDNVNPNNQPGGAPGAAGAVFPGGAVGNQRQFGMNSPMSDQVLAALLTVQSEQLAALAQLAMQNATNEDVKAFAQTQLNAAEQLASQFQNLSGNYARSDFGAAQDPLRRGVAGRRPENPSSVPPRSPREPVFEPQDNPARNPNAATNARGRQEIEAETNTAIAGGLNQQGIQQGATQTFGTGRGMANTAGSLDPVSLFRQIGQQTTTQIQQQLQNRSGNAFDVAVVNYSIVELTRALATLQVVGQSTANELGGVVNEGIQQTQLALRQAEQLAGQLANSDDNRSRTNQIRRSDLPRSERGRITP